MKVAHSGDQHFMNKQPILKDIIKCTGYAADVLIKEAPALILLTGDIVDFLGSPDGIEIGTPAHLAASDFVTRCCMIAPTLLVKGTSTHDGPNSLVRLAQPGIIYPVFVAERPCQVGLTVDNEFLDMGDLSATVTMEEGMMRAVISCLPSINKAGLMAFASGTVGETTRETVDLMRDVFQAWGIINQRARDKGVVTILAGHGTVTGSQTSTGQVMTGKDLEFSSGDLALAACDIYCLGHIHKAQELPGNVFYSGSITRLNYGETEEKGFYIHEIAEGALSSRFVTTPAREMITAKTETLPTIDVVKDIKPGDSFRLMYEVNEEDTGKVDEEAIRAEAIARGAVDVKIEKKIIPKVRTRAEGISQEHDLYKKLMKWGETNDYAITVDMAEKLAALEISDVETICQAINEKTGGAYDTNKVAA